VLKEMALKGLCVAALAGAFAAFATQAALAQNDVSLTAGRRLAADHCGRCHAVDLRDQSPNPKAPHFRDLGEKFPMDGLRQALIEHMIIGHPEMPIQTLTPVEVNDLIAYLKSLQTSAHRPPLKHRITSEPG
jgi:mono/diheme cytochrome c family protein